MTKIINYAPWKKALYEAWRVFVPAFIGVIALQFQMGVNIYEWQSWLRSLFISAVLAGLKAVAKWFRNTYGKQNYSSAIYKLPL